jgi:hypothetical protein
MRKKCPQMSLKKTLEHVGFIDVFISHNERLIPQDVVPDGRDPASSRKVTMLSYSAKKE